MKKLLFFLIVVICFSCSDESPAERANKLLNKQYPKLGSIEKLDTVKGYTDAFSLFRSANRLQWRADSIIASRVKSKKGLTQVEKNDLLLDGKIIYDLKKEEAFVILKHSLNGDKEEVIALSATIKNKDAIYVIYFDKDVSKIECIYAKR